MIEIKSNASQKDIKSRFGIHQLGAIFNDPILYLFEAH